MEEIKSIKSEDQEISQLLNEVVRMSWPGPFVGNSEIIPKLEKVKVLLASPSISFNQKFRLIKVVDDALAFLNNHPENDPYLAQSYMGGGYPAFSEFDIYEKDSIRIISTIKILLKLMKDSLEQPTGEVFSSSTDLAYSLTASTIEDAENQLRFVYPGIILKVIMEGEREVKIIISQKRPAEEYVMGEISLPISKNDFYSQLDSMWAPYV